MKTEIIEFKDTEIYCPVKDGHIYVAIKPICEALGVSSDRQNDRIKRDEILSQLHTTMGATGRDGKTYNMVCLPLQYIFGWLFTINHTKVKEDSRDQVVQYKIECYDVLYNHFWNNAKLIHRKEQLLTQSEKRIDQLESKKKALNKSIKAEKERFKKIALAPANQMDLFIENESSHASDAS